ncbi:MAG: metallophosphoesterase, partial [Flavobacteriales bacterium]
MLRLLIPLGFLLAIDLYFFQLVKTSCQDLAERWRYLWYVVFWGISASTIVLIYFGSARESLPNHIRYYLFSLLLVVLVPKLVGVLFLLGEDLFRLTKGIIGAASSSEEPFLANRRKFISNAALITASIPFASMLYGMAVTAFNFSVKRKTIVFDDLPEAFDGLTIAQISDMHSGSFSSDSFLSSAIDEILSLKPDLIFFTGDLVNNEATEAEPFIGQLSRLKAKLGVHSILGNHDYGDYGPWPSKEAKAQNLERLKAVHGKSGWNL